MFEHRQLSSEIVWNAQKQFDWQLENEVTERATEKEINLYYGPNRPNQSLIFTLVGDICERPRRTCFESATHRPSK